MTDRIPERALCIKKIIKQLKKREFISHEEIQMILDKYGVTWSKSGLIATFLNEMWPLRVYSVYGKGYTIHRR